MVSHNKESGFGSGSDSGLRALYASGTGCGDGNCPGYGDEDGSGYG